MLNQDFVSPSDPRFESPTDIRTACSMLSQAEGKVVILAGGTNLMPIYNKRQPAIRPDFLLHLGRLNLNYIRLADQTLIVGACATLDSIASSEVVNEYVPLLGKACFEIGSPAIRNAGTLAGNVCNAAPWADGLTALLALDASVVIASANGDRKMKVEDFVEAPSRVALKRGEIVTEFHIPLLSPGHKWAWMKQGQRKASAISVASIALCMKVNDGVCQDVRVAVGAIARIPYISRVAVEILAGRPLTECLAEEAGTAMSKEVNPREDSRAPSWYKKKILGVIVKRLITKFT